MSANYGNSFFYVFSCVWKLTLQTSAGSLDAEHLFDTARDGEWSSLQIRLKARIHYTKFIVKKGMLFLLKRLQYSYNV